MKTKLLLFIILFIPSFNLAQDYFPLEVGNEWYYEDAGHSPAFGAYSSGMISVVDKKTMPNGKEYFQLYDFGRTSNNFIWDYIRIDSFYLFKYDQSKNSEDTLFDFSMIKSYRQYESMEIDTIQMFGSNEIILIYNSMTIHYVFSKKYGLIGYGQPLGTGTVTNYFNITGCRISGIIYGEKIDYSDYLPLAVGNRWFYETKSNPDGINEVTDTIQLKVISKKIMPNNMEYYELSQNYPNTNYKYARVDSCKFSFYSAQRNSDTLYMDFSKGYNKNSFQLKEQFYTVFSYQKYRDGDITKFIKNIGLSSIGLNTYQRYRLIGFQIGDSTYGYVDVADDYENPVITDYQLAQNYPNPFNPETNIYVVMPKSGYVKLTVYDLTGREISRLYQGELTSGRHNFKFNGSALSSGIYFYRLESPGLTQTKRMLLLK